MHQLLDPGMLLEHEIFSGPRAPWDEEPFDEGAEFSRAAEKEKTGEIRSIFVSDVHLGSRHAKADRLLEFLEGKRPRYLYLVGDFVDGWKLKKGWYWNQAHSGLVQRVMEMSGEGTQVFYTPGNHDEFLRGFLYKLGNIHIGNEFIHTTADRRRFLVTHGDQFDSFEKNARWLSLLGDIGYDLLLRVNPAVDWVRRRFGANDRPLSLQIKRRIKVFTSFLSDFERRIVRHAREKGCEGIICGHLHTPALRDQEGISYCNTGDWVESCTALVERKDGRIELYQRIP